MTWKILTIILTLSLVGFCIPPFIDLNQIHEAKSEFEVNLILNQNRNYPVIIVTVSNQQAKQAASDILKRTLQTQPDSSFALLIDCRKFRFDLNKTLGICDRYDKDQEIPEGSDPNFMCQFMYPDPIRIKQKGHIITKNHGTIYLGDAQKFNENYLSGMVKQHISDFVQYIEDQYDLDDFLQTTSDFKVSKLPKLLYFDDNLLAPLFVRKIAAMVDGKIFVGVTDDTEIAKSYGAEFDSIVLLQYDFQTQKYTHSSIQFDSQRPIETLTQNDQIKEYLKTKKSRDMVIDFEHRDSIIYNYSSIYQISNLIAHGRMILLEIAKDQEFACPYLASASKRYDTMYNYICFSSQENQLIERFTKNSMDNSILLIMDSISTGKLIPSDAENLYPYIPSKISRQRVSTDTQAQHCLRTASFSKRDPIFYYFNEKSHQDQVALMNYLNSLSEVTSLLYFCQIYLPDEYLVNKFDLKQNTIFTLFDEDGKGNMKKFQHSKVKSFIEIKMFLRQITIQKMLKVYEERIVHGSVKEIHSAQELTENCFKQKCIIGLIATGKYREDVEMKMLKQVKLIFEEEGFKFFWIDGICHWDIPKQLKILGKKQKAIEKSYIFMYSEKQINYSLWKTSKFWDKKELIRWIKSLRNEKNIKRLRFGIDIEDRTCEKKEEKKIEQL